MHRKGPMLNPAMARAGWLAWLLALAGCGADRALLCPDGRYASVPRDCGSVVRYLPPSVRYGVFELPVIRGVPVPCEIGGEKVSSELLGLVSEKVKSLDHRRKAVCRRLQETGCGVLQPVLRADFDRIDLDLADLKERILKNPGKDGLEKSLTSWVRRMREPNGFFRMLEEGDRLLDAGDAAGAAGRYASALGLSPASAGYHRLALARLRENDRAGAAESYIKCHMSDRRESACALRVAELALEKTPPDDKDLMEALQTLRYLEKNAVRPDVKAYVRHYLGLVALESGDFAKGRALMLETLDYLGIFSGYYLAVADAFLISEGSGDREALAGEALDSLLRSSRLALKKCGAALQSRLARHFREQGNRALDPLRREKSWPKVEESFTRLAR